MKILYIDTTTKDLVVALVEENCIRDFSQINCGVRHSETLCNCVGSALKECNINFEDIDAYAIAVGPGSFTGIRIGIATVKGYCLAVPKPVIAVNCLQAISFSQKCGNRGRAVIDAGNGYYFADYTKDVAPCLINYGDSRVSDVGKGDGAAEWMDGAVKIIRERYVTEQFDSEIVPLYIRRSQAEERK